MDILEFLKNFLVSNNVTAALAFVGLINLAFDAIRMTIRLFKFFINPLNVKFEKIDSFVSSNVLFIKFRLYNYGKVNLCFSECFIRIGNANISSCRIPRFAFDNSMYPWIEDLSRYIPHRIVLTAFPFDIHAGDFKDISIAFNIGDLKNLEKSIKLSHLILRTQLQSMRKRVPFFL